VAAPVDLKNNEFDLVSVGRGLIGDPDWVKKVAAGRFSQIRLFTRKDMLGDLEIRGIRRGSASRRL
jgi:2,4-dienoyl-CoA reductase-like NADH-dependent reductase (Old Yellow Enzyme family)